MESSPGSPSLFAEDAAALFRPQGKNGTETRAKAAVPRPNLVRKLRRDSPLFPGFDSSFATLRSFGRGMAQGRADDF